MDAALGVEAVKASGSNPQKEIAMLSVLVGVLLVLWVIGMMTGTLLGGLAHLLLVGAAVIFVIRMGRGADPLHRG